MSTAIALALLIALHAPQQAAEEPAPAADAVETPASADDTAPTDSARATADDDTAPSSGGENPPSEEPAAMEAPADAPVDDDDAPAAVDPAATDPEASDGKAPDMAAPAPPAPLDDDTSSAAAPPVDDGRARTSRKPTAVDKVDDEQPVTSPLVITAQVGTGLAACCCGMPLVGAIGIPLNIIPIAGAILGPCVMQAGFCAMTAVVGGGAEVFVGDALGPGHGALLPVIAAQGVAHLAASLIGTVVGFATMGAALGLALPNLPADPIDQLGYLYNDPFMLLAMAVTAFVFVAAIGASLATGPIAYALTAEPKKSQAFKMPRWVESAPPRRAVVVEAVRY